MRLTVFLTFAVCACSTSLTSGEAPRAAAQVTYGEFIPTDSTLVFVDNVRQPTGKLIRIEAAAIESLSVVKRRAAQARFGPPVVRAIFFYLKRAR